MLFLAETAIKRLINLPKGMAGCSPVSCGFITNHSQAVVKDWGKASDTKSQSNKEPKIQLKTGISESIKLIGLIVLLQLLD